MERKIVFINQATGYLTIDIINAFAKVFQEVALITGSVRVQDEKLNTRVALSKVVKYNRGGVFRKAASWIIGSVQIYFLLLMKYRNYERIYFTIPPIAYLFPGGRKRIFSLIVFDLYPEALQAFGIGKRNWLFRLWSRRNRKIIPRMYKVFTISENMKDGILSYSDQTKVHSIPNWSAFSGMVPIPKNENSIIQSEGLQNKFIIQYSGNIGTTHNVEVIVELANLLRMESDIEIQIIGRGKRATKIGEMINQYNLSNCRLLSFRKDGELFESLCVADLAIVTLDDKAPDISVPSKTYNIMSAGLPVLVIASEDSALSGIVKRYNFGGVFAKEHVPHMKDFVLELKRNPEIRTHYAANSLKAANDFTNRNAAKYIDIYNA